MNAYLNKLNSMSSNDMLKSIDENFYKNITNKNELKKFIQLYADKFCEEKNIAQLNVIFKKMNKNDFAYYKNENYTITINSFFLKAFDIFKEIQSTGFLFELCETFVHELRHHEQTVGYGKDIHPIVKNFAVICRSPENYGFLSEYFTYSGNPIELDARYYTHKKLQQVKIFQPYLKNNFYIYAETSEANSKYLNYAVLLNDDDFLNENNITKTKMYKKNINNIISCVKNIAKQYNIGFVGGGTSKTYSWKQNLENIKLSGIIGAEIAPDFFDENFVNDLNPEEVEDKINEDLMIFDQVFEEDDLEHIKEVLMNKKNEIQNDGVSTQNLSEENYAE